MKDNANNIEQVSKSVLGKEMRKPVHDVMKNINDENNAVKDDLVDLTQKIDNYKPPVAPFKMGFGDWFGLYSVEFAPASNNSAYEDKYQKCLKDDELFIEF